MDDLLEGFVRVSRLPQLDGPMNVGNPGEFTVAELANMVIELTGSKSTVEDRPLPADDPKQRKPDITRAKELIGFEPRVPLREGLTRTIANFKERMAAQKDA